jgi:hypothetical protein
MNWKEVYTKIFLKELGKTTNEVAVKEHLPLWWQNTRSKGKSGLRLTDAGYEVLCDIDIETYDVPYPRDMPITTQVIIYLDQFIDCPYYITPRSIIVTDQKKAVELTLFNGDLRKYGITKAMKRQEKD